MRKIAPQLNALLEFDLCVKGSGGLKTDACKKELRALLAVARAAGRYKDQSKVMAPGIRCVCHGQGVCQGCSLDRALARLERVSGGKP